MNELSAEEKVFRNPNLPFEERLDYLMSILTLEEKITFLYHIADDVPRLNIRHYYHGNEALHGVVRPGTATVFPQAIAFGATWDPNLIFQVATAISDEARAKYHHEPEGSGHSNGLLTFWSPTVNMARDPRWGRTAETYGEDPWLTSRLGIQFVKGLQGSDPKYLKVVSTPKHYAGNNEDHNRARCKPNINMRDLREYFVPAFRDLIIEGKAQSIMSAYNAIFDIPVSLSRFMMWVLLREEWGFEGYAVTDCSAIENAMPWQHRYVWTFPEACAGAINAGIDLECGHLYKKGYLMDAFKKGLVTEGTINRAARNVLNTYFKLGMFDPVDRVPFSQIPLSVVGCDKHSDLALKVAQESIVLLKNDNREGRPMLPLDWSKVKRIAIIGPNAGVCQFGDYSGVPRNHPISPLEGIQRELRDKTGEEKSTIILDYIPWITASQSKNFHVIPALNLKPTKDCNKHEGLKRTLFSQSNFQGDSAISVDSKLDINWGNYIADASVSNAFQTTETIPNLKTTSNLHDQTFSAIWEGFLKPEIDGSYEICLEFKSKLSGQKPTLAINEQPVPLKVKLDLKANTSVAVRIECPIIGASTILSLQWRLPKLSKDEQFRREVKAAKKADVVLAFLGLGYAYEHEGHDKKDLELPSEQNEMMRHVLKANPKLISILITGSPLAVNWLQENTPAILCAWYPGERGGDAIADVLFGAYNPGGKLPLTFYKSLEQIPAFNEYDLTKGKTYWYLKDDPLYPFGFGLSYTKFEYIQLSLSKKSYINAETAKIIVEIKNTGEMDGDEILQVYCRYVEARGGHRTKDALPLIQLKAFQRIHLKSREKNSISFDLPIKNLAFYDTEIKNYVVLGGQVEILVGSSSKDIRLKEIISIVD